MTEIHICTASDENYGKYAGVMMASVLKHSKKYEKIYFHILDGGISDFDKKYIEKLKKIKDFSITYYKINDDEYDICPVSYLPIATFYRVKIASILKNLDKVLYLDCDLIVCRSLAQLYGTDITDYWIAGVEDPLAIKNKIRLKYEEKDLYFNAGVLLINLKKWREDNIESRLYEYMRNSCEKIKWGDQDLLNDVLHSKALAVDLRWNSQYYPFGHTYKSEKEYQYALKHPFIVHYILADKPWMQNSKVKRKKYYFKMFKQTPWFYNYKKDYYLKLLKNFATLKVRKFFFRLWMTIDLIFE